MNIFDDLNVEFLNFLVEEWYVILLELEWNDNYWDWLAGSIDIWVVDTFLSLNWYVLIIPILI